MKNKAEKEKAEEALTESQNWMLRLVKGLKTDSKEVEGA